MSTLLIKNIEMLVTMDDQRRELQHSNIYINNGFIQAIGDAQDMPTTADEIIDLSGHIVFPGLINTHHHFYQTLTRAVPKAQDANLFNWLTTLYPIWSRFGPEEMRISALTGVGLDKLFEAIDGAFDEFNKRVSTSEVLDCLNQLKLVDILEEPQFAAVLRANFAKSRREQGQDPEEEPHRSRAPRPSCIPFLRRWRPGSCAGR